LGPGVVPRMHHRAPCERRGFTLTHTGGVQIGLGTTLDELLLDRVGLEGNPVNCGPYVTFRCLIFVQQRGLVMTSPYPPSSDRVPAIVIWSLVSPTSPPRVWITAGHGSLSGATHSATDTASIQVTSTYLYFFSFLDFWGTCSS